VRSDRGGLRGRRCGKDLNYWFTDAVLQSLPSSNWTQRLTTAAAVLRQPTGRGWMRAKVVAPAPASPLSLYQKDDNFVRVKNTASYWFRRPSVVPQVDGRSPKVTHQTNMMNPAGSLARRTSGGVSHGPDHLRRIEALSRPDPQSPQLQTENEADFHVALKKVGQILSQGAKFDPKPEPDRLPATALPVDAWVAPSFLSQQVPVCRSSRNECIR
jgi:hypothetical protein